MSIEKNKEAFINPIDEDNVAENPHSLTYGHHRGSVPIIPTKEGDIKHKSLSAMQQQTNSQLMQIKEQMELLAKQATLQHKCVEFGTQQACRKYCKRPQGEQSSLEKGGPF